MEVQQLLRELVEAEKEEDEDRTAAREREREGGKANMYAGQNVSLAPSLPRRLCCWIEHAGFNLDTSWEAQLTPLQPYVM